MGRKRALVIGNTAAFIEADSYIDDLKTSGFECEFIAKPSEIKSGDYDLLVLCGVSENLGAAAATVRMVELAAHGPILILTGHNDAENIAQFSTPRTTVLSKIFSRRQFVETALRLVGQTVPTA